MNLSKLSLEMAVVGVGLVIISLIVSYLMEYAQGKPINWYPDHFWGMVNGTFISGALFHLLCEVGGVNQWYVNQYVRLL